MISKIISSLYRLFLIPIEAIRNAKMMKQQLSLRNKLFADKFKEEQRASDILFATVKCGKTTFDELASTFKEKQDVDLIYKRLDDEGQEIKEEDAK